MPPADTNMLRMSEEKEKKEKCILTPVFFFSLQKQQLTLFQNS